MASPSVFSLVVWNGSGWEYDSSGPFLTRVQAAAERTLIRDSGVAEGNVKIVPHARDEDVEAKIAHWRRIWLIQRPPLHPFLSPSYFVGWDDRSGRPNFDERKDAVEFDDEKSAEAETQRAQRAEAEFGHKGAPAPRLVFEDKE